MKIKTNFSDKSNLTETELIKNLYLDSIQNNKEWSYLLRMALLLVKDFESTHEFTSVQFAYYIFLKYAKTTHDYRPLFDFSTNFGFYPISSKLFSSEERISSKFEACYAYNVINEKYSESGFVSTFEQNKAEQEILKLDTENSDVSYIAPTSFGKSNSIIKLVSRHPDKAFLIIEPTRALLNQMSSDLYARIKDRKIIVHEEMYSNEKNFIGVLTQERAIRLITKHPTIKIDIVCIDEAHNIFAGDSRSLLLTILIKWLKENGNSRFYYYSPVIENSESLKFNRRHHISEVRIKNNLKEPEIMVYTKENKTYKYNRFFDTSYFIKDSDNYIRYIKEQSLSRNFIYLRSPKKIELFAQYLSNFIFPVIVSSEISELIDVLKTHVNEKFYLCKILEKGILYLHAKLPDILKEYLLCKYQQIKDIKYLIANTVILEGMNLPIETLFIMNTYKLDEKQLTNLIGRVNRLNYIFSADKLDVGKLLPPIHFVDSNEWNSKTSNIENTVHKLASISKDEIENPLLPEFSATTDKKKEAEKKAKQMQESLLSEKENDEIAKLKKVFYKFGLNKFYKHLNVDFFNELNFQIKQYQNLESKDVIKVLSNIFIKPFLNNINDYEFKRLNNVAAIKYYENYYKLFSSTFLSEKIKLMFKYLKKGPRVFYIGQQFGEITYENSDAPLFIDKSKKTDEELINIAIAKIKMEDDFLSYTLNNFLSFMNEVDVIDEHSLNSYLYGFEDEDIIKFNKLGIPGFILSMLRKDNQLSNITILSNGSVVGNEIYKNYKFSKDNFIQFHLDKYIVLSN